MKRTRLQSWILIVASFAILAVFAKFAGEYFRRHYRTHLTQKTPNVIVLSFCSLRMEHLRAYNPSARPLPVLDRFFDESLVFTNAVNGLPWTNVTGFIDVGVMRQLGYPHAKRKSLRIPALPINKHTPQNEANHSLNYAVEKVRTYELNYADGFESLRDMVMQSAGEPFFLSVHIKYMHFPLIDTVNQRDLWKREFSPQSAARLEAYLANPDAYPEKAPLFLTLFADPTLVRGNKTIRSYAPDFRQVRIGQVYQMLTDERLLSAWRKSADFAGDLKILNEAYYLKLRNLDEQLEDVLALYGDPVLKGNTVVVLTGDHGESFMENDRFLHADGVHENQIRFPMAAHVPFLHLKKKVELSDQYNLADHDQLIRELVYPEATVETVRAGMRHWGKNVFLRNCAGTVSGVRTSRAMKLVADLEGLRLYDLKTDPGETRDLKDERPEDYFSLKEEYLRLSHMKRNLFACENEKDPYDGPRPHLRLKPEFF